jgi:hypothetical protein
MNAGVCTGPCGVVNVPTRAADQESACVTRKENEDEVIGGGSTG